MKKIALGLGALLLALIVIKVGLSARSGETDQEKIQRSLDSSIQASKEGKPGSVMDLIGNQITFNSSDASSQLGDLNKFIRNQKPDIEIEDRTATVNGNIAQISSPVTMTVSLLGQHQSIRFPHVILVFHKEPATRWLIFPTEEWKLEQVEVPNFNPSQLSQ